MAMKIFGTVVGILILILGITILAMNEYGVDKLTTTIEVNLPWQINLDEGHFSYGDFSGKDGTAFITFSRDDEGYPAIAICPLDYPAESGLFTPYGVQDVRHQNGAIKIMWERQRGENTGIGIMLCVAGIVLLLLCSALGKKKNTD